MRQRGNDGQPASELRKEFTTKHALSETEKLAGQSPVAAWNARTSVRSRIHSLAPSLFGLSDNRNNHKALLAAHQLPGIVFLQPAA